MFNNSYQLRAVRKAGGGHQVAEDALLRLPWAGIFEPWRPFVAVAAASRRAERRKRHGRPFQGIQLELFPENPHPSNSAKDGAPGISHKSYISSSTRPLFDLFPEAYE